MTELSSNVARARTQIIAIGLGAVAAGIAIVVGAVLPAEFGVDPIGLGRVSGLSALYAPEERVVATKSQHAQSQRSYTTVWRSDVVDIPIDTYESGNLSEVEYKVHMRPGTTLLYSWQVSGVSTPDEFYTEFHGHTVTAGKAMTVAYYRKATGTRDSGSLVAPFDGVHGWFFQNQAGGPVRVRLRLSGFYDLVAPGQPGNEAGLIAHSITDPV